MGQCARSESPVQDVERIHPLLARVSVDHWAELESGEILETERLLGVVTASLVGLLNQSEVPVRK